jgi:glycosyltransferase involved in cell wall biosynthesis
MDLSIDILLPVHGEANFISEALISVLDEMNLEDKLYVITDRISTSTNSIIQYFASKDQRITVIKSLEPGIVNALNLGIESSNSEFIARMDSDDLVINGRFDAQEKFLISHPEYVLVGSNIKMIDEYGNFIKRKYYPSQNYVIKRMLDYYNPIAHPAVMYRRISILEAGSYWVGTDQFEDYDLWLRLAKLGKFKNLRRCFLNYRIHENQFSSESNSFLRKKDDINHSNSNKMHFRMTKELYNSFKDSSLSFFNPRNILIYIFCLAINPIIVLQLTYFYLINSNYSKLLLNKK